MKLEELIKKYLKNCELQNNLNFKTLKAYRIDLNQFALFMINKDNFYNKENVIEYIYELKNKKYSIKTIKRKIATLKTFFSYLNNEDIIDLNPFYKIKVRIKEPFILPKTIPLRELTILFNYIIYELNKSNKKSYRYKEIVRDRAILELLIGTGIRIGEACMLKKDDVKYLNNIIKISGKGAKERIIPIYYSGLLESLKLYEKIFSEDLIKSEYFFLNKRNNRLSSQSVRNMIKRYCKLAGIELHITPHMFRHTFATMLLEQDVDSRYIQMLLGHSNILTTQIYTHVTSNKKNEIMKYKNPRYKIKINEG